MKTSKRSKRPMPSDLPSALAVIEELAQESAPGAPPASAHQRIFGRRSEKGLPVPEQGELPFASAAGTVAEAAEDERPESIEVVRAHTRRHSGRRPLPADLPREIVEIEPADVDLKCKGCEREKTENTDLAAFGRINR